MRFFKVITKYGSTNCEQNVDFPTINLPKNKFSPRRPPQNKCVEKNPEKPMQWLSKDNSVTT